MTIETTATPVELESRCAHGCGRVARWMLTASTNSISATTFSCNEHRPEREICSLRMLATSLDRILTERRAA